MGSKRPGRRTRMRTVVIIMMLVVIFVIMMGTRVLEVGNSKKVPVQGHDDRTVEQKWNDAREWAEERKK
jgi:uncharacterized membrane protein affecting hemolysin expression